MTKRFLLPVFAGLFSTEFGWSFEKKIASFLEYHCYDCHGDGRDRGGLDLESLKSDLSDPAAYARWELVYKRVEKGEMPPKKVKERPESKELVEFLGDLNPALTQAHEEEKGTVLRRLNRREYENTMNDLFGTNLRLAEMLPEDGRSHEFDTVGEALGLSMVHLEKYLEAARLVIDSAIQKEIAKPEVKNIPAHFRESEIAKSLGKQWKQLPDGAIVRFEGGGYPSGLLRNSGVPVSGWYEIEVTGYAHQSKAPVVCAISGESYVRGSGKPIYRYVSFPPDKPTTVRFRQWIEQRYMLVVEPRDIVFPFPRPKVIDDYQGPGFAFVSASLKGPLVDEFPTRGHKLIFGDLDRREIMPGNPRDREKSWYRPKFEVITENENAAAMGSLKRVATKAWRRAVNETELTSYLTLFQKEREREESFESALRTALAAVFVSPNFLFLQEESGALGQTALSSRLSYFLNRTAPLAGMQKGTLREQAERLIARKEFDRFIADFADAWLDLREIDFTAPDKNLFPEFDPYLRDSLVPETRAYLKELFSGNHSVSAIVKSDFAMLNSRLAEHYGLPPVEGPEIRKVDLPAESPRGGFLTQASVLKVTANGTNTSPVVRGVWVLERIMGDPPQPPPPGIPGVEPDIRGAETLREILDKHRDSQSCNACHQKIDPPGFALEAFNPIGGYRERFRSMGGGERIQKEIRGRKVRFRLGPEVDSAGALPDGRPFEDFREFRDLLARNEEALARNFVTKLLTFATGREMGFSDRPEISGIVRKAAADGYRIRDLLHLAISSKIFQSK
ncbi:MAG: DUF1588 domain-containing protein [Akkermansiaceae bacterium]